MGLNNLATTGHYFLVITGELILLFLVISFIVGLIQELVPDEKMQAVLGKPRKLWGNTLGALFGALTPFCSCSTIPILVGLLGGKAPFGACISFLMASPLLNPIIIGLLITLFGWRITLVYAITGFAFAVLSGVVWERLGLQADIKELQLVNLQGGCCESTCCQPPQMGMIDLALLDQPVASPSRAKTVARGAARKSWALFCQVLPYLLIGAGIGAIIYGFVPTSWVSNIAGPGNILAVPVAALVGIPMYIRAETIIPIGLTLMKKGMALGTVAALIIGGAGASIPEVTLLAGIFKPRAVIAFVVSIFVMAVATGYILNVVF